jgi:phosphatidylethanolamine N-methyltransferase
METTVSKDYTFEYAPAEFNTWLLFRRVVDLILMCDFTSYCLFAAACGYTSPPSENPASTSLRWLVGWLLVGINLWVKVDAHRVVRDYNWYWGDFFYLVEQEMVFDGVYKILKNPMYTVGYIGYYGVSLIAASYKVLLVSIIAHTAQLAFLAWVEDPHFEKTYNDQSAKKEIIEGGS